MTLMCIYVKNVQLVINICMYVFFICMKKFFWRFCLSYCVKIVPVGQFLGPKGKPNKLLNVYCNLILEFLQHSVTILIY